MKKTKVLVVGGGGREHALIWKLAQSIKVSRLYCAPGNAGIGQIADCVPLRVDDIQGIVDFSLKEGIDLVVIGPELPLTLGLADELEKVGIRVFGPSGKAAEIEGSKAFAKDLMAKYDIPSARYGVFTDRETARNFAREMKGPWVVKADGLAAGKGVIICSTLEETYEAVDTIMTGTFGSAGDKIVIEEFLEGEELSILAFTDGKKVVPMVPSQDHKRVFDKDLGPNTGGMGAYSPVPKGTAELVQEVEEKILYPVIRAMDNEGRPYRGVLYAGLMLTADGIKVLEFNARFGDPETQVVLPRLESDLFEIMLAVVEGKLAEVDIEWTDKACVSVVMASGGYPGKYTTGYPIQGLDQIPADAIVFHSGTAMKDGQIVTAGGRVLSVTALGKDIAAAQHQAYEGIKKISFQDSHCRCDIGYRALQK